MEQDTRIPRKLVSVFRVQVRWADADANRHVNNAAYFTYMEQARIDWLQRVGMQTTAKGEGPVVVHASRDYRKPSPMIAGVDVRFHVGPAGRTSFPTYYEIVAHDDPDLVYATGKAVMVWTDRATGASRPVPEEMRALLA